MDDHDRGVEAGDVADVTNSTAFLSIDSLLEEGKLVEDRAVLLKARYKELHDRVLQIYSNDNFLLKRARQCRKDLDIEKQRVERCGEVAMADDSSIQELKKELAAAEHELSIAQEKESMLQVEALELERKKQTLTHDVEESIAQEAARLIPKIEAHRAEIKRLGDDIEGAAKKFDGMKDDHGRLVLQEESIRDEIADGNHSVAEAKTEFARVEREPDRAKKQADVVVKAAQTAGKELGNLRDKVAGQGTLLGNLREKQQQLIRQHDELYKTLEASKAQIAQRQKLLDSITEGLRNDTNARQELEDSIRRAEEALKAGHVGLVRERDSLGRCQREKDQGLRHFKRLEQAKADLGAETGMFEKQREILQREEHQLEGMRRQSAQELADLKRDVDILINSFLKEQAFEQRCAADKEQLHRLIRDMEDDVAARAGEEQQLRRDASALSMKREQQSREASRMNGKVQLAEGDLKVKRVVVLELSKRNDELVAQLNGVVEHWQRVKRERSAKAQLIQSMSQTMSETQEKIKILENELEVLRRESLIKDQELRKKEHEAHEHRQKCKTLRIERNRWNKKLEAARQQEEDLKRQMSKLNSVITSTEDAMLRLKKGYEDAVENRNFTGIQLIDRNDELCILYEKANIQEAVLKNGMQQLSQRDAEVKRLAVDLADLQREIDLCQRVLPQVRDMEEDLAEAMLQLDEERWRAEVLESDQADPTNAARWRKLGRVGGDKPPAGSATALAKAKGETQPAAKAVTAGTAASVAGGKGSGEGEGPSADFIELSQKQEQLEARLASVNEKLMEKELVLEEITELANSLRQQALSGRDFTLALAKKVTQYQSGIKGKTKRMMATLSELSMVQASSIKLEMDIEAAEETLTVAQERVEAGEAPTDEVARRYEREQQQIAERRRQREEARLQEQREATQGKPSVDQRNDTYLVGDDDFMLPKPFGAHAPFKPGYSHNVARFQRKPQLPPLEDDDDE